MKNIKTKIIALVSCMTVALSLFTAPAYAEETQIKNIIFMIPDGGGYGMMDFANLVKTSGGFNDEKFPYRTPADTSPLTIKSYLHGSVENHSANSVVTDSAASATAMSTGHKTNNGYVGIDKNMVPIATILEAAQSKGKAAGLISNSEWMAATPAGFSSHASYRDDYYNIYQQIENQGLQVVFGSSGYDYVSKYASIQNAIDSGYNVVESKADLANVQPGDKLWGNRYYQLESYPRTASDITLAEYTQAAITALSADEDGFFLMVEGSFTDMGGHSNEAVIGASEYIAFDAAFKVAVDFAKGRSDTIVIGAPDHDTGGLAYIEGGMDAEAALAADGTNPSTIAWEGTNHTSQNIPIWIYAPEGIDLPTELNPVAGDTPETRGDYKNKTGNYIIDNTGMAPWLASLIGADLDALSAELFVDVTDIGVYTPEGRFEFASGDKYVYPNQDEYYKNGEKISLDGKVTVYVNERFYVPSEMIEADDWNYSGEIFNGIPGSGTQEDPYLIKNAYDFIEFTNNLSEGETYSGKYFSQTADLDLSKYQTYYNGAPSSATFDGIYDGKGKTITVNISQTFDNCIFPKVTGTVLNLSTAGTINGTYIGGIARSLYPTGKIINCCSTVSIDAVLAGGLVYNQYGKISNSFFAGDIKASGGSYAIGLKHGNGKFENSYFNSLYSQRTKNGVTSISLENMKNEFAQLLNSGRASAASSLGCDESLIAFWTQNAGELPYMYVPVSAVESVAVTPSEITVAPGESIQFTATVIGENNPSQEVGWYISPDSTCGSAITESGYLTISETETQDTFTIMAKSKQDGSKAGIAKVTVQK